MSEQGILFEMELGETPTQQQEMLGAFVAECSLYDTESLIALREAELQTLSDCEARIHKLNVLIDQR